MLQAFPFFGTDLQEVYDRLNEFLHGLADADVLVEVDDIRANTKYYPEYDRTATTIEVFLDFSGSSDPADTASQVRELHRRVVAEESPKESQLATSSENPAPPPDDFDPFLN